MTIVSANFADEGPGIARPPAWVTDGRADTLEDAAFFCGGALSHLWTSVSRDGVPLALLRQRLALRAAEACAVQAGRMERAGELRDSVHFLEPGDRPGPAGEMYLTWQRGIDHPMSVEALHRALPNAPSRHIATALGHDLRQAERQPALRRAATVIEMVMRETPRAGSTALLLADVAVSHAMRWSHVIPVLSLGLSTRDLRRTGDGLRAACYHACAAGAVDVVREAEHLTRAAARLRAIAPKLRARGAREAVKLFLTRDAVAPTALTSLRSDRAARRFCLRLVELGVVRELTGRETFRLFGL